MKKISLILRYISAAATVLLLAALGLSCLDIYIKGNLPANLSESGVHLSPVYSREIVSSYLSALAPLFFCYVLILLAALFFQAIAPVKVSPLPITEDYRLLLSEKRLGELPEGALAQRRLRRRVKLAATLALFVCALPPLAYLLNGDNFTSWELDRVIGAMLTRLIPWLILAFAVALAAAFALKKSVLAELEILRACPSGKAANEDTREKNDKGLLLVRVLVFAVAALFILLGVMNGGARDVLIKAINICTECVGLG